MALITSVCPVYLAARRIWRWSASTSNEFWVVSSLQPPVDVSAAAKSLLGQKCGQKVKLHSGSCAFRYRHTTASAKYCSTHCALRWAHLLCNMIELPLRRCSHAYLISCRTMADSLAVFDVDYWLRQPRPAEFHVSQPYQVACWSKLSQKEGGHTCHGNTEGIPAG